MKTIRKYFLVTAGFLEALVFSGCLFGWPSLLLVLQKEGIYKNLCDVTTENETDTGKQTESCDEQRVYMTLIFAIAAVSYGVAAVLIGMLLEWAGLWVTRLIGSGMTISGFLFLAYLTPERSAYLWPALNLIALGSNQLRLSGFQLADLFPAYRVTILTMYSSAYSISTTFFLGVQVLHENQLPFRHIFLAATVIAVLTLVPTFFMPRRKIDAGGKIENDVNNEKGNLPMLPIGASKNSQPEFCRNNRRKNISGCLQYVFSFSGMLHMFWHFMNMWMILFYSATFNIWMTRITSDQDKVSYFIKMTGICAILAPIFVPVVGIVTDLLIKRAQKHPDNVTKLARTMQAPTYPMLVATLIVVCTVICKLFFSETAVYASIILISLARPAVIGSCTSYIKFRFPDKHFNILNGIFTTVISVLCLVQYPVIEWMTSSNCAYKQVHVNLLIFLIASLASPCHILIAKNSRKYAKLMINNKDAS